MTKPKPFITQLQAEGTGIERQLISKEKHEKALKLVRAMPILEPDKTMYIRALVRKAMRGEVEPEVFKEFAEATDTWHWIKTAIPERVVRTSGRSKRTENRGNP